jgi:hypothetical protein
VYCTSTAHSAITPLLIHLQLLVGPRLTRVIITRLGLLQFFFFLRSGIFHMVEHCFPLLVLRKAPGSPLSQRLCGRGGNLSPDNRRSGEMGTFRLFTPQMPHQGGSPCLDETPANPFRRFEFRVPCTSEDFCESRLCKDCTPLYSCCAMLFTTSNCSTPP